MNQRSIGIENDANPDKELTEEGYQTCGKLLREICDRYQIPLDREHIKRHSEIKPTQCCGTINVEKLIEIAKGGSSMDLEQIARGLSAARTFNPEAPEVDYIKRFIQNGGKPEDYARENLFMDAVVNNLWIATMGVHAPASEKKFWRQWGLDHPDKNVPEVLSFQWYGDHVKPLKDEIERLKKLPAKEVIKEVEKIVEVPVEKIVEKIVEKPIEKIVYKDRIVYKDGPIVAALKAVLKLKTVQKLIDLIKK